MFKLWKGTDIMTGRVTDTDLNRMQLVGTILVTGIYYVEREGGRERGNPLYMLRLYDARWVG
jgi:hypothetical protein